MSFALALLFAVAAAESVEGQAPQAEWASRARILAGVPSNAAALLYSAADGGNIPAFVAAVPLPADEGAYRVPFAVEIDGPALLGEQPEERLDVHIVAYALDADGGIGAYFSQWLRLDVGELGDAIRAGGVKFIGHVDLEPGSFVLRLLVREPRSDRYALRSVALDLGTTGVEMRPSPPLFEDDADAWLMTREAEDGEPGENALAELFAGSRRAPPAALPLLLAGHEQQAELLLPGGGSAHPRPVLWLHDNQGRRLERVELSVVERSATSLTGVVRMRVGFVVPDLAEGAYGLSVATGSGRARRTEQPQILAYLLAPGRDAITNWTDLGRSPTRRQRRSGDTTLGQVSGRRMARLVGAIEDGYIEALRDLTAGSEEAAIERLAKLEAEVVDRLEDEAPHALARGQLARALALGERDVEALLPLVALHMELDRSYRGERRHLLAAHSRRMAATLAQRYAKEVGSREANALVSQILAVMGADLQELQLWVPATNLLERALEYDDTNTYALLSLAVGYEKLGNNAEAVLYLRRLVRADPKSAEGRIRLALNLRRIGRESESAQLLRRVIGEDNPDWALSLAYQELASSHLRAGRPEAAVEWLEDGVARLPSEPRLYLQLCYALERAGRPDRAEYTIGVMLEVPRRDGESARYLYNRRVQGDREEIQRLLERSSAYRMTALEKSLRLESADDRG